MQGVDLDSDINATNLNLLRDLQRIFNAIVSLVPRVLQNLVVKLRLPLPLILAALRDMTCRLSMVDAKDLHQNCHRWWNGGYGKAFTVAWKVQVVNVSGWTQEIALSLGENFSAEILLHIPEGK